MQQGLHTLWLAPIAMTLLTAVIGSAAWLVGRWIPRLRSVSGFVTAVALVPGCSLALNIGGIPLWSALMLGVGLSVTAGRVAAKWPTLLIRLSRVGAVVGVSVVVVLAFALTLGAGWWERFQIRRHPVPGNGAPNILLIVLDTVRAISLGVYGNRADPTPFIDSVASLGLRFEDAFSTSPWTTPSHASLMTGRLPTELLVDWSHGLRRRHPTLAEVLGRAGYLTAGFTANLENTNFTSGIGRGFRHYEDYLPSWANLARSNEVSRRVVESSWFIRWIGRRGYFVRKRGPTVTETFLSWLDRQPARPWFAFLNFFDAHALYESRPEIAARFGAPVALEQTNDVALDRTGWPPEEVKRQQAAYLASIATLDGHLRDLFQALDRRKALANTIIVITADHGEEFYEHHAMRHGNTLYRPSIEVPLIVLRPGAEGRGQVVRSPVSLRSIPRTLATLVPGVDPSVFPGEDLLKLAAREGPGRTKPTEAAFSMVQAVPRQPERLPVHWGPLYSAFDGEYHYIVDRRGREELYVASDSFEVTNLASNPALATRLAWLRAAVRRAKGATHEPNS
jgi:arylsulfatase A-like enzyme